MLNISLHSIKIKTLAVIVAVLGVVFLFQTLYIAPMIKADNVRTAMYAQESLANQLSDNVAFSFSQAIVELETIADLSSVQSMDKELLDQAVADVDNLTQFFNYYYVVDKEGTRISFPSKPAMVGQKLPPEGLEWVQETIRQGRTISPNLYVSSSGTLVSGFATPIRTPESGIQGVLRGVFVVSEENTVLSTVQNAKVGKNGYAYIVTQNGWLIAHPQKELDPNNVALYNYMNYEPVKRVAKGESGLVEYTYDDGKRWVAAYRPIKATGWGLIVQQPKADILEEAASKSAVVYRLFFFALLFSAVALVVLIHYEVKPLTSLLEDIRSGKVSKKRIYGKGEIGHLAQEFGALYSNLLQSKDALQESEAHFRALFENDHAVMLLIAPENGDIVDANPAACAFYGYSKQHLINKKIVHLSSENESSVLERLDEAKTDEKTHFQVIHRLAGGGTRDVEVYTSPITMHGRALIHAIIHDITDRKHAEEERRKLEAQMQQSQKMESLGMLASGIAHDFNNLMMGVMASAELVLDDVPQDSPRVREGVESIINAARRAGDLGKQMLAYSGEAKLVVKPHDINEIISSMAHLLKASIPKKVAIKYDLDTNLPAVEADATQISQILLNLVTNAAQSIGDNDGTIHVATGVRDCDKAYLANTYLDEQLKPGKYAFLKVADTGSGITDENLAKIFDPFFTTKPDGRGLGLSLVLGIVRGHKGGLKVDTTPGQGTTFTILLACSEKAIAPAVKKAAPGEAWSGTGTVLIVDDEEIVRRVADRMLQKLGFKVLTAADGVEGVELFRKHADDVSVVLLDLSMPRMDGEEAFDEIRKIRSDAVVVLSSGYDAKEATSRFTGKGLSGFLQKPYRLDRLSQKLRDVLEGAD